MGSWPKLRALLWPGMENQANVVEYSIAFGVHDPRGFVGALGELEQAGLLTGTRVDEQQGVLTAILLEAPPPALTPELQAQQNMKVGAYVALMGNFVRLWHTQTRNPTRPSVLVIEAKTRHYPCRASRGTRAGQVPGDALRGDQLSAQLADPGRRRPAHARRLREILRRTMDQPPAQERRQPHPHRRRSASRSHARNCAASSR